MGLRMGKIVEWVVSPITGFPPKGIAQTKHSQAHNARPNDASQVAFPVRKGDETATLREALNQAINELREDGTIAEISEKYFGTDLSQAPSAN